MAFYVHLGPFQSIWLGVIPTLGFTLCMGYIPTVFLALFRNFFTLKADIYAQAKLQLWYFAFLVFFVLLVTTLAQSLVQTAAEIIKHPTMTLHLLAENMPAATHFYMEFVLIQWSSHAINLTRHVPLIKFLLAKKLYSDAEAKEMAEPEDQDFYGIGSRSSRFTINLLVGIIFSTLCPVCAFLALINFLICRIVYGYLLVYAETKKPDLGGVFFFTQLRHTILGTGLYAVLMIGVLMLRARTKGPMLLAMPSLLYVISTYYHFNHHFHWETLPFKDICFNKDSIPKVDGGRKYIQEEFLSDEQRKAIKFGMYSQVVPVKKTRTESAPSPLHEKLAATRSTPVTKRSPAD